MSNSVKSPISLTNNTKKEIDLDVDEICSLYKEEFKMDISKYFSNLSKISVYKCLDTGLRFYYPKIEGDEFLYDNLKILFPKLLNTTYYAPWKWEYEIALNYINTNDSVFEIGCGSGFFLLKLKEKDIICRGIELNQNSVDSACNNSLDVKKITVEEMAMSKSKFDTVCCFQVLEHVGEINSFIKAAVDLIKKNGKLIIAVPNNTPFLFKKDKYNTLNLPPHHLNLWNKESLVNLQKLFPLKVVDVIVEKLPTDGYDFHRYCEINGNYDFLKSLLGKEVIMKVHRKFIRMFHNYIKGKNIVVVFTKL